MTLAYWITGGVLAAAFLGASFMKLSASRAQLFEKGQKWTEDFSATGVKLIAAAELLGAIGVIAAPATGIATILGPIAAVGLAAVMAGAAIVHARRKEPLVPNIVLGSLAAATAVIGFQVWV